MSNPNGTMTTIEEIALSLYCQLEQGDWEKTELEMIEEALEYAVKSSAPLARPGE